MGPEYAGRGEARRSLLLLWGRQPAPTRGPKPGLSVERIVRTAIGLADREGLDAVSMRRVADELGVGTMSIYTYVPAKAELFDLMVDAVFGEQAMELEAALSALGPRAGWRAGLEARARVDWALSERHPWLVHVASARAVLGPNETTVFELTLGIVDGLGLRGREMVAVIDLVATYVDGAARAAAEAGAAAAATGMDDNEWWLERAPLLEELMDAQRFPVVSKVGADGGFDVAPDAANYNLAFALEDFEFGLQRVLDGIEAFLASRTRGRRRATSRTSRRRPRRGAGA
jgi:AcrR family transcriptional regulator